jgi:hypothetical protein
MKENFYHSPGGRCKNSQASSASGLYSLFGPGVRYTIWLGSSMSTRCHIPCGTTSPSPGSTSMSSTGLSRKTTFTRPEIRYKTSSPSGCISPACGEFSDIVATPNVAPSTENGGSGLSGICDAANSWSMPIEFSDGLNRYGLFIAHYSKWSGRESDIQCSGSPMSVSGAEDSQASSMTDTSGRQLQRCLPGQFAASSLLYIPMPRDICIFIETAAPTVGRGERSRLITIGLVYSQLSLSCSHHLESTRLYSDTYSSFSSRVSCWLLLN